MASPKKEKTTNAKKGIAGLSGERGKRSVVTPAA